MRFEERELKSYGEPVTADMLKEGEVYFSVQFADEDMLIPIMETWVFAGRNIDPEDTGVQHQHLYFQDVESYRQGVLRVRYRRKLRLSGPNWGEY